MVKNSYKSSLELGRKLPTKEGKIKLHESQLSSTIWHIQMKSFVLSNESRL